MASIVIPEDDGHAQPLISPETRVAGPNEFKDQTLSGRLSVETKKLWRIVGPAIFSRVAAYSMNIVSQAFAGHIGSVELAAFSIANTVIVGFNFGLLLGMASALETLCGQAFGAKRYHMLGIYMQRSWMILFLCCFILLPVYVFAAPLMRLLGQPDDVAELSGVAACWMIPLHFSFAFQFPLQRYVFILYYIIYIYIYMHGHLFFSLWGRFLQCQMKNNVIAWVSLVALIFNVLGSWLCVYVFNFGIVGICIVLDISWWILVVSLYVYTACGGCPLTWTGFSVQAFSGLWEFVKLSFASGVMLCLENWYYRILILMTGYLGNATIAVDALSICMSINGWEMMIPLAFFAATGVRVSNELGAGNGSAAKFATKVSVVQSTIIGVFFCALIMILHDKIAYIFTSVADVVSEVNQLSYLLGITIILNSVQPILSGVAVGSGWQAYVAYINLFCYYIVGLPLGIIMGWVFKLGVKGIWGGMIFGGTAVQTIILTVITMRTDWDNEAKKARERVDRFSYASPDDGSESERVVA
ncbi:hypothetical protein SAY86_012022 [Trapa natans]|uniref:Protein DETOXIFICATION n=1 Tax=Trapa natans TaxID=22666 RepID=A0AAN7RCI0_TRANT|nr:hypothetical protein SAY86_012022 [Trapa natans]